MQLNKYFNICNFLNIKTFQNLTNTTDISDSFKNIFLSTYYALGIFQGSDTKASQSLCASAETQKNINVWLIN